MKILPVKLTFAIFLLTILVGVGIYSVARANIYDTGLLTYYNFDTNQFTGGNNINDLNPNATKNNLSLVGSPSLATGQMSQSISLAANQYGKTSVGVAILGSSALTFSAWVYITDFSKSGKVIGYDDGSTGCGGNDSFSLSVSASQNVALRAVNNVGTNGFVTAAAIATSTWTFVSVTMSGSVLSGYKNGVLNATASLTNNYNTGTSYPIYIGSTSGNVNNPGGCGTSWLIGRVDDARVYTRALSANEVQQLYLQGVGHHMGDF